MADNDPNLIDQKLKAQVDAQAAQIQMLKRQLESQNVRRDNKNPQYNQNFDPTQNQQNQNSQYQGVDPNQMILESITQHAAQRAAKEVNKTTKQNQSREEAIKQRMERLVEDYPALREEDSPLVAKARDEYARIERENPSMAEEDRYELAVKSAASFLGARPATAPVESYAFDGDWTMPSTNNPALPRKSTKSRLTPQIIKNAQLMGINVDANTKEGQTNLAELSEYSARFNADADERHYRYQ